jgi:stearoyl-CoA desaturase (delta-9 desaturase)
VDDPHSPQVLGINRVLWGGVFLYVKEAHDKQTLERYGLGTPDDWLERNIYGNRAKVGLIAMGLINVTLFGIVPGLLMLAVQIVWIPFWAAGVVNGIGHYWGYRNWSSADASTNIFPLGILIGGEELHNNHNAFGSRPNSPTDGTSSTSAGCISAFSTCWDWRKSRIAPRPRFTQAKPVADLDTLQAVITYRYDVLAKYAKSLKNTYAEELRALRGFAPQDAKLLKGLKRWLNRDEEQLRGEERARLAEALAKSVKLSTVYTMRRELVALWERSNASREQLLKQLQDWCGRAEASGIRQLEEFSLRLRCYA